MSLTVRLDAKELVDLLDLASKEARNACRRAVDRSARAARKETIEALSRDIGVKKSEFAKSVPPIKASTQTSLSASWTVGKARILIGKTWGAHLPVRGGSGLLASTFRETGGKSSSLSAPKAFTIPAGGQTLVMVRTGNGRKAIKAVYAENPVAGMLQDDGAPRKQWQKAASRELSEQLPTELAKVFAGQRVGGSSGGGDE